MMKDVCRPLLLDVRSEVLDSALFRYRLAKMKAVSDCLSSILMAGCIPLVAPRAFETR